MPKVLLVEDDTTLSENLKSCLESEGFILDISGDGLDALEYLRSYTYDLVILDWELPGQQGPEICREYRSGGGKSPVLFLTGRSDLPDKATGFVAGADDYLTKPFHVTELVMRMHALLRRPRGYQAARAQMDYLEINYDSRQVRADGNSVSLSPMEYSVLEFLFKHPYQLFSSEAIVERVWAASADRSPATLRPFMKRLRDKITPADKECLVRTVRGEGYIFTDQN